MTPRRRGEFEQQSKLSLVTSSTHDSLPCQFLPFHASVRSRCKKMLLVRSNPEPCLRRTDRRVEWTVCYSACLAMDFGESQPWVLPHWGSSGLAPEPRRVA